MKRLRLWCPHALVCALLLASGSASSQPPQNPQFDCSGELSRLLGVVAVEAGGVGASRAVCPSGTLERINFDVEIGQEAILRFDFRQQAFDQAIFHLDVRDSGQRPIDWIQATPQAGEITGTAKQGIELSINPPAELVATVQLVTIAVTIHDGSKSWSRDIAIQLTVGEEQPLFRDQFEIDPVIGQFSQRNSEPRPIHLISARAAGGR